MTVGSYAQMPTPLTERAVRHAALHPESAGIIAELLARDAAILRVLRWIARTTPEQGDTP